MSHFLLSETNDKYFSMQLTTEDANYCIFQTEHIAFPATIHVCYIDNNTYYCRAVIVFLYLKKNNCERCETRAVLNGVAFSKC